MLVSYLKKTDGCDQTTGDPTAFGRIAYDPVSFGEQGEQTIMNQGMYPGMNPGVDPGMSAGFYR